MKKVISAFLIFAITVCSFSVIANASESQVLDSGICGAGKSDNVTWAYYESGELVISGSGCMDWYDYSTEFYKPQPWYDYLDKISCITIEPGVDCIGAYAFWVNSDISSPLRIINLPRSVTSIDVTFINKNNPSYRNETGHYICYQGNSSQLSNISLCSTTPYKAKYEERLPDGTLGFYEPTEIIRETVNYDIETNYLNIFWTVTYNGEEPQPYIKLFINDSDTNPFIITGWVGDYYKSVYAECDYRPALDTDVKLVWTVEGDLTKQSEETDALGNVKAISFGLLEKGTCTIRVDMVDSSGKVIATDQKTVTSLKINRDDPTDIKLKKIKEEFNYYIIMNAASVIYYTLTVVSIIFSPIINIIDKLKGY